MMPQSYEEKSRSWARTRMAQKSGDYADKIKFRREMIVGRHKLDVCEFYKNIFTVEDVTI